jgi:hypothetical protein
MEFIRKSKLFISVRSAGICVAQIYWSEKHGDWRIYSVNSSNAEPDDLRKIADKLDELNKIGG